METCGDNIFLMDKTLRMNVVDWFTYMTYMTQKEEIRIFLRDNSK